jgi:hypothetical protein
MNAYDLVRSPVLRAASIGIAAIFVCYMAEVFLLSVRLPFAGGCWGPPTSNLFIAEYGPWVVGVSGLLLLAYGAVFLVTAFLDWRSESKLA